jgi:membrane protein DedA with SNARE-associated domain
MVAAARLPRGSHAALALVGVAAATALGALTLGVVEPPDLEGLLADVADALGAWTYALVAGLAFLETGAFVGLIAPGETAIVLGGVVAAEGDVALVPMLAIAWAAAAAGDLTSYFLGRRLGRRFLDAHGPRLRITPDRLERVDAFFERHGPRAIFFGRFVGIVRAVAPFLAGSARMRLRSFLPASLLGTGIWSATFVLIGYGFHSSFGGAVDAVTRGALALAVVAAAVLIVRSRRRSRTA